jgi:phosphoribosylformimino-5-aminoimidazole carboxamide ribotide isomerase
VTKAYQPRNVSERSPVRIIPVIDLRDGVVVRGVGGRRAEYRPWVSPLCGTADAFGVAWALLERAGAKELFVADLDAIAGRPPALAIIERLRTLGVNVWVDAGLRHADDAEPLATAGVEGLVAGLETLAGPGELAGLVKRFGAERVIFSLDLMDGVSLGCSHDWPREVPEIAAAAIGQGVCRLIVLDLARVGGSAGSGPEDLYRELALAHPEIEVIAGGGVRDRNDLRRLEDCGVAAVLVATALHEGQLP